MTSGDEIFAGSEPFSIARRWQNEAIKAEASYPDAIALSTVDETGMPNTRIMLLKAIEDDGFVFFTNYQSRKGQELDSAGKASFVMHWKSLGRQIRVRGLVSKENADASDAYYATRPLGSRIGAWASRQSQPLASRQFLMDAVKSAETTYGDNPPRPPHWGGYKIAPLEIEFWADGEFRLHDRFRWTRSSVTADWATQRLNP